ncbi:unnamed protein product [Arabidopsis arenosa]|uniref:Uncharacterized protein n=1 Tax=Arabidopsis arenosa TaxID=38785 RepID=A0A8S2A1K6_ARAAE|nr:unnamed protein product [Arabidopsis arenosa]
MMVDKATVVLKLSFVVETVDKDVERDQRRENTQENQENQGCDKLLREDIGSEFRASNEEFISTGRASEENMIVYEGEPSQHYELLESGEDLGFEGAEVDNNDMSIEVTPVVNVEWEDGLNVNIRQEFESKQAVADLVEKGAHKNCFEFVIVKSDTKLYVVKCCENVKLSCKNDNRDLVATKFMEWAKAYTEPEFEKLYDAFMKRYPAASAYLDKNVGQNKWARCFFPGTRYNIDTTNVVESINGVFLQARGYSLLLMIDAIVAKLNQWFNKYRKLSLETPRNQIMVPYVANEVHTRCLEAKLLPVTELNNYFLEYSVAGVNGSNYVVDLERKLALASILILTDICVCML